MPIARHRIRDKQYSARLVCKVWNGWSPPQVYNPSAFALTDPWEGFFLAGPVEWIDDYVTPGYKKIVSQGGIVMNDFTRVRVWTEEPESTLNVGPYADWGRMEIKGPWGLYLLRIGRLGTEFALDADIARARSIALTKAYAKMNQSQILGGEAVHDLDQSLQMLRRPFGSSIGLLKKITKRRDQLLKKSASNITKASANAWLEYRYGWKPILMDIDTIVQECGARATFRRREGGSQRLVARSMEKVSCRNVRKDLSAGVPGGSLLRTTGETLTSIDAQVSAGVIYTLVSDVDSEWLAGFLGTRPRDLLPTIWECLPYSFVADWFVNVGDWLNAVIPSPKISVLGNWTTAVRKCRVSICNTVDSTYAGRTNSTSATGSWNQDQVQRIVGSSVAPTPIMTGKPLSLLHTVDALSLSLAPIGRSLAKLKH